MRAGSRAAGERLVAFRAPRARRTDRRVCAHAAVRSVRAQRGSGLAVVYGWNTTSRAMRRLPSKTGRSDARRIKLKSYRASSRRAI